MTSARKAGKGVILIIMLGLAACGKSRIVDERPVVPTTLAIKFEHTVDSLPFFTDTLLYINSSGDRFLVTDLQYFISRLTLHRDDGHDFTVGGDQGIHYIDEKLPLSKLWVLDQDIPSGTFDSVSFTFGLNEQDNISFIFPDPPERDMNWPVILGGGYHYMKMNLLWKKDSMDRTNPFNFHLGIGQIYKGGVINPDSITSYVQNFFTVCPANSGFSLQQGKVAVMTIRMNINRWFSGNNNFDFASYKNTMMQNQDAMNKACLNGRGAFSIRFSLQPVNTDVNANE
jgi:hypothetical protein